MKILNYNISQIKTLIVEGTNLLVITSPANLGKNALSSQIGSIRDSNWRTSLICADVNTNIDSLSHDIIQQALPDKAEDTLPIVSQVHKYLEHSARNGIIPVIMVEDAHKLSLEVLEFVLQLAELRYAESLFRIVLFADETINDRFDDPKLKGLTTGVLRNIHIPSFSEEGTKEHIDSHLPSNNDIDGLFDDLDIQEDTSKSHYGRVVIIIGLISIIPIFLYFNDHENEGITDPDTIISIQPQHAISGESQIDMQQIEPMEQVTPLGEEDQELEDEDVKVSEGDSFIDDLLPSIVSAPLTESEEGSEISLVELAEAVEKMEHPVIEEVEDELMPETDDENIYNLETVPNYLSGIKGPGWLRQQPAESYVLQLVSAQYMSNIKNLLSGQSGIHDQLSGYVKYTPSGKSRYLLLYGIYPDGKTAKAAIGQLPIELQSTNPWPRTIGNVINELDTVSEPPTEDELSEGISGFG